LGGEIAMTSMGTDKIKAQTINQSMHCMELIDAKFKDSNPTETVRRIKAILLQAGITTKEIWNSSLVSGCYSVRIEIQGSRIGQNGKGMTKEFALASGYAELMERLQTGYFYVGEQDFELEVYHGFRYIPEEVYLTIDEILETNEPWLEKLYNLALENSSSCFTKRNYLELLAFQRHNITEKEFIALPFYDIKTGKKVHIPTALLEAHYMTNGTCAGNSVHEAIVQGLSEIIERHHNLKIHNKCITPPEIPDEYLSKFQNIYESIALIRESGRYELIVKDCSLGEGFPVIASVLIDREKQSYIVKFGAHPVFEIALERSMTELFQGRNLNNAAAVRNTLYDTADAEKIDIIHNVIKNASGEYHYSFFSKEADYVFHPFEDRSSSSNADLYAYAVSFLQEKGYDILVRNASYLGFYTFQIIVPSYSEVFPNSMLRIREKVSHLKAAETVRHLEAAAEGDYKNLYTYTKYKEFFSMENTLESLLLLPLNKEQGIKDYYIIYFIASLKLKDYKNTLKLCRLLQQVTLSREETDYFKCLQRYLELSEHEDKVSVITDCLKQFFSPSVVKTVACDYIDITRLAQNYKFTCKGFQCSECVNKGICNYIKIKDVIMKLKDCFKSSAALLQAELFF
jgi:ribosomal protein S12 methylthiotransferase accessory factor